MSINTSKPTASRANKRLWIQETTLLLLDQNKVPPVFAEIAACWALFWLNNFEVLSQKRPPNTDADLVKLVLRSLRSSELRAKGLPHFPYGMPAHRIKAMATTAFCSDFPEKQQRYISEMLRRAN